MYFGVARVSQHMNWKPRPVREEVDEVRLFEEEVVIRGQENAVRPEVGQVVRVPEYPCRVRG